MAFVNRELKVTYGSTVVGKDTNYFIDGKFRLDKSYTTATVSFDIVVGGVAGYSDATFLSDCLALEAAFRTPRQILKVEFVNPGATRTHETFDPSINTGFDADPVIVKQGSPHDTGRSRRYSISVTVQLPADLSGQNGRQKSSVTLQYTDAKRRRLIVSGTYTALGSNSARTQFENSIDTYIATLLLAFGGTWEGPFDNQESANDTNKILDFSRVYEELIFNQAVGILDSPYIRRQSLKISKSTPAPGDSTVMGTVYRLEEIQINYSAAIDKTISQDLPTVYSGVVRPFLLSTALTLAGGSGQAIVNEMPDYDYVENRIDVSITIMAPSTGRLIYCDARTDDVFDAGKDLIPVWDGKRLSKFNFQGPADLRRTVTIVTRFVGTPNQVSARKIDGASGGIVGLLEPFPQGGNTATNSPAGGGSALGATDEDSDEMASVVIDPIAGDNASSLSKIFLGKNVTTRPYRMGTPGYSLEITEFTVVKRFAYILPVKRESKTVTGSGINSSGSPPASGTTGGSSPTINAPKVATGINL
jgi:hypothetical protein